MTDSDVMSDSDNASSGPDVDPEDDWAPDQPIDATDDPADDPADDPGDGSSYVGSDDPEEEWDDDDDAYAEAWEDRDPPRSLRSLVLPFLIGALSGALLLGAAWAGAALFADPGPAQPGGPGAQAESTAALATASAEPTPAAAAARATRLDRCTRSDETVAEPLRAAGPVMDQWEVHIGAMNKLMVGAITLQQATAFWNQTRLGAKRRLERFARADATTRRQGLDCPVPERLGRASKALRRCAERVQADERTLALARDAARTWQRHVEDMDMLRMGHLTPAAASAAWLANWQRGARQVEAYRGAAHGAASGTTAC